MNNISEFTLQKHDFSVFGTGLLRPECVWADDDGIWCSDARGGVAKLSKSGPPSLLGHGISEPNGFSRRPDGAFVVAGLADGGLYLIHPDGKTELLLQALNGKPLGAVNHAWAEQNGRIWVSVMTRHARWYDAMQDEAADGYILLIDENGARIVADDIDLTNEVKVSPDGKYLYAAETFARRIIRFPISSNGDLGAKQVVGPENLGRGAYPDGFSIDAAGNIWVTIVTRNGISLITAEGECSVIYEDVNPTSIDALVTAMENNAGTADLLGACMMVDGPLRLPTSLAFGGDDGKTVFIGSLAMDHLATFKAPFVVAHGRF